jgi:hypothetical protein
MIPLNLNNDFFADTNELIEKELLAERILGNQLKRDLDFMYKTVDYIYKSHAKEKLLNKEVGIIEHTIPRLIIFNYLDNIVRINAEKKVALLKEKAKADLLLANTSAIRNEEEKVIGSDGKIGISLSKTFKPEENKEEKKFDPLMTASSLKKSTTKPLGASQSPPKEENEPEDAEELRKLYGRFWTWKDYLPENTKEDVLDGAEAVRHVNISVKQDIWDFLITEGMRPRLKGNPHSKENKLLMQEYLASKKKVEEDDKKKYPEDQRAPKLWNNPDIEKDHQHRVNADPKICYVDGRIEQLLNLVDRLAIQLASYNKDRWDELVAQVIECYKLDDKLAPMQSSPTKSHHPISPHK